MVDTGRSMEVPAREALAKALNLVMESKDATISLQDWTNARVVMEELSLYGYVLSNVGASLTAAAPELHEALKRARVALLHYRRLDPNAFDAWPLMDRIEAALAKARALPAQEPSP